MYMLFDVLSYLQGMLQFNTQIESRTRIQRLKILLYHLNEELPPSRHPFSHRLQKHDFRKNQRRLQNPIHPHPRQKRLHGHR